MLFAAASFPVSLSGQDVPLASTPPMGWNSWDAPVNPEE
jgi:hypothetical protein